MPRAAWLAFSTPLFSRVLGFVWGVTWRCPQCTGHGELRFSFQWDRCLWSPARGSFSLWEVSERVGRHEPQPQPSCQAPGWDRAQTPRACVGSPRLPSHHWGVLGALLSPIHSLGGTMRSGTMSSCTELRDYSCCGLVGAAEGFVPLGGSLPPPRGTRDVVERGGEAGWLLSCLGAGLYKPQSAPE